MSNRLVYKLQKLTLLIVGGLAIHTASCSAQLQSVDSEKQDQTETIDVTTTANTQGDAGKPAKPTHDRADVVSNPVAVPTGFQTYTIGNQYSFVYPQDWLIDRNATSTNFVMIWSKEPPLFRESDEIPTDLAKTDINLSETPFEAIADNYQGTITEFDESIDRKEALQLDGMEALRVWTSGGAFDFEYTMLTIVKLPDNRSVTIASFYDIQDPVVIENLETMHNSFKRLD
jgi:hypothetical protein